MPALKLTVEYLPLVELKVGIFCAFSIPGTSHIYISLINGSSTLTPFVILLPMPKQCLSGLSHKVYSFDCKYELLGLKCRDFHRALESNPRPLSGLTCFIGNK